MSASPDKSVAIAAVPLRMAEDQHEIEFSINDPGDVRAVAWCPEKRLVMARGEPQFDEVLTLFVEISPNGPKRKRRFAIIPTGQVLGVPDGRALTFVGTAVSGSGRVAHVFEVRTVS